MKLKDKRIEIFTETHTINENGFAVKTLTPISPPVWAYFRHLSGKEIFAANAHQAVEEVQFVINWRDDLSTTHVIRYRGDIYEITRVDVFEGYKQDITIYAKRRIKQ